MDYLQYIDGENDWFYTDCVWCFKPCYKWITFNTLISSKFPCPSLTTKVLNLVINGLPSIPLPKV